MKTEDWDAIKQWLFFLLIACGMTIYFGLGVICGRTILFDHHATTKLTITLSW